MDAVEEETRSSNAVAAPLMALPPGYRFRPTAYELCRYYLYDKVTIGRCEWENIIIDVDLLAHQPWDLPGMDWNGNDGYYFYAREKKSKAAGSTNNDRIIKNSKPECCWKVNGSHDVEEQGVLWGKRNALNHCIGSDKKNKTDWLMQEFVLNPSLIAQAGCNNDDDIVLCRVYKKKRDSDSKEVEVKAKRGGEDQVISTGKSCRGRKSSKNVAVEIVPPLAISGSRQPVKRKRIDAPSSSTACFPQTTIQESRTQPAPAVASTSSTTTSSCFQPSAAAAAASCSAQSYIQETHHPAAVASWTLAGYPYIWETYSSELPVNYMKSTMKGSLQPLGSAQTYNTIQQTQPAAAATQCRNNNCDQVSASRWSSGIAPVDDDPKKLYYREELTDLIKTYDQAAWQQERELDRLTFDPDLLLNWLNR